jgi:hypothetical protein
MALYSYYADLKALFVVYIPDWHIIPGPASGFFGGYRAKKLKNQFITDTYKTIPKWHICCYI